MSYTEEDEQRVAEAIEHAISNIDSRVIDDIDMSLVDNPWGMIARAALEAMEREPLEDVPEWVDRLIWTRGVGWEALCSFRKADDTEDDGYKWRMYSGTGETADDAIAAALTAAGLPEHVEYLHETDAYRNAVAAAKGGE